MVRGKVKKSYLCNKIKESELSIMYKMLQKSKSVTYKCYKISTL